MPKLTSWRDLPKILPDTRIHDIVTTIRTLVAGSLRGLRLRSALGPKPDMAYLGWQGNGNLGDDAMFVALRDCLLPRVARPVPAQDVFPSAVRVGRALGTSPKILLLGGGTLIGRAHWLTRWRILREAFPAASTAAIGVGAEDPEAFTRSGLGGKEELEAWARELHEMNHLSVRGPRSADILASLGVDARPVGDPALLLSGVAPAAEDTGRVGISVGREGPIWGDQHDVENAIWALADHLADSGRQCMLFRLDQRDPIPPPQVKIEVFDSSGGVTALLREISRCSTLVGERLHAIVLAHACGIPALALEYRPKVGDHMAFCGLTDWTIRTDRITPRALIEKWEDLESDVGRQRPYLTTVVKQASESLKRECETFVPAD